MLKAGIVIGERYEIIEQVGAGGMSYVYKAKDHKLNRYVAVKVLKSEFSENKGFVSKFRVEAQAAAGLAHPNIVNVYDVGEDNGLHYIVMELVEGITLKEYIEKKARLSVKEAISIAIQVSMGIEAAHNNHIIHRDIKPQNIIISREGKVKVTDFGIARAATSNTITSNVMGSVHYTSPEQARGGYSDEKSDIYSLGITMFEMLTGRVPFNGETTVSVAIKHIQDEMPSPRDFVPEIPASVEQIIFKCTQKSPDRRYDNVSQVIADLKESLINPEASFVQMNRVDEDAVTKMIQEDEIKEIRRNTRPAMSRENLEESGEYVRRSEHYMPEEDEDDEDEDDMDPKMDKIVTILGIVAAAIIGLVILFGVGKAFGVFGGSKDNSDSTDSSVAMVTTSPTEAVDDSEMVEVPSILGLSVEEATKTLNEVGLGFTQNGTIASDVIEEGLIAQQSVEAGEKVAKNTRILGVVSSGAAAFNLTDVTGRSAEEAKKILEGLELTVVQTEEYSNEVEEGKVISMDPAANTPVGKGDTVTIAVSKGTENAKVPGLAGLSEDAAKLALEAVGLALGSVEETYSANVSEGLVISQSYSEGTELKPGTYVNIVVSKGPEPEEIKTYKGVINIQKPDGFVEGEVKFVLTQQVGSETISRTYDAGTLDETSFPYKLEMYGQSGISTGTVTVYVNEVALSETYTVNFEAVEE
ncbi:MAG: Stk1 family PASTA domain-containing Ser/Thr kinase [Lachnospiraceae bacterium]|nr:Stk1 family PASTA domain-containing Ser/Thr kinase [Lachnospiraceae bacterium]